MDNTKIAEIAFENCQILGCSYADIRIESIHDENISISKGTIDPIEQIKSRGFGIRVINNGAWGFAASDNLDEENIRQKAVLASEIALASAYVNNSPIELAKAKPQVGVYSTPIQIDPFRISLEEKIAFLQDIDSAIAELGGESVNSRSCFASFRRREKYFRSFEGSELNQTLIHSGAGMSLGMAKGHRERYERSYPTSSGQYESKGYELLGEMKMKEAIPRLIEEIKMMMSAEDCPEKETTLLLSGDQVSLQMHESIGHALELDRVFGSERNFSGTSFATPDNLDKLMYGSEIVNVSSDLTIPNGLATAGWDDEGIPAQKEYLIKNGKLVNYLSSRETAEKIGKISTGAMRSNSWSNVPIVRISNIVLEPGKKSFEEILSGIDDGIYMDGVKSWSIDDERKYFQFGCEIGWLIKGGKLTTPIKNPTYSGCTTDFWNKCRAIANRDSYQVWGTPNCGKGQPGQNARTAQGASPACFENIRVGG